MTKSIKTLRQQLESLQITVSNLTTELEDIYSKYFDNLGNSVGKQLIIASYQICTQKYPENFLKLSFNERHQLQQKIKYFKHLFNQKLADDLLDIDYPNEKIIDNLRNILLKDQPKIKENDELKIDNEEIEENNLSYKTAENEFIDNDDDELLSPDILLAFHLQIERSIHETLYDISQTINRCFQKYSILSRQLPPKILDIALQAEENNSMMSRTPNLLSLLIEKEQIEDSEAKDITPITAICMRLSEIEFSDPTLGVNRTQIRKVVSQIEKISEQYFKTITQYKIASAEAAWRSSWFDEQ